MISDTNTPRTILGALTAFVVLAVALAPLASSRSATEFDGGDFFSVGTLAMGVTVVLAVAVAGVLMRYRRRTAAATAGVGLVLELLGLHSLTAPALIPLGAGIALGAVTVATASAVGAVAGTMSAVLAPGALTAPALPRRYADYLSGPYPFQPTGAVVAVVALVLIVGTAIVWWNEAAPDRPHEPGHRRTLLVAELLVVFGLIGTWWVVGAQLWMVVLVVIAATAITVVSARALPSGLLLMATAAATSLIVTTTNRPTTFESVSIGSDISAAVPIGIAIVAAAAIGAYRPAPRVGYAVLAILSAAAIVTYIGPPTPTWGTSLVMDVVATALATYAVTSAVRREPGGIDPPRLLLGLGVLFGPTAFAVLLRNRMDFGWTAYTPLTSATSYAPSADLAISSCLALVVVAVCCYAHLRLESNNRQGPPINRSNPLPPDAETP
ncbi:hypothetical protein ABH922_003575 [Rhodococcus sp. 27YEA15]|uniref:hypothetical protein n=1 Tax=Rhodococcus sp. 27YEA15 TaxID=3156259 RepID=UPI003C7ECE55